MTNMNAKSRRALFLELAGKTGGVSAQDVYDEAVARGDEATPEAYHNLGRRLAAKGFLRGAKVDNRTVYEVAGNPDEHWLDEEVLHSLIDPEHPIEALSFYREALRHLTDIPMDLWIEIRTVLAQEDGREMFYDAIVGYAESLKDCLEACVIAKDAHDQISLSGALGAAEAELSLLRGLAKFGLGLTMEAIDLPASVDIGIARVRRNPDLRFYRPDYLRDEIDRRVEEGPFLRAVEAAHGPALIIAAVDGSTRSGLLTIDGENGDFTVGAAPSISINGAAAQLNREIEVSSNRRRTPVYLRLPERPEDVLRSDNRYTIMARMFFPEMTESQYMHAQWNAMNLLEFRAALRIMQRWTTQEHDVEVPPAQVVMMDGTVVPNDRDSNHYSQSDSFGRIARELIEAAAEATRQSEQKRTLVAGVVKNAQVHVLAPVINWRLSRHIGTGNIRPLRTWPLDYMNKIQDQHLLTRILTAGRRQGEPWVRSAFVMRPFYAATDLVDRASRTIHPGDELQRRSEKAHLVADTEGSSPRDAFWAYQFNRDSDPYAALVDREWIAHFFVGATVHADAKQALPRMEFIVPSPTMEEGPFPQIAMQFGGVFLRALQQDGFRVADEHSMFDKGRLDILPSTLIRVHDTVKIWTQHLLSISQELISRRIAGYMKERGVRIRPWSRAELDRYIRTLRASRGQEKVAAGRAYAVLAPPSDEEGA